MKPKSKGDFLFVESRDFLRRTDLSAQAKVLSSILRSYCNGEGMCFPTIPQLATDSGLSESTVEKYLLELRTREVVAWVIFRDEFKHRRRLYRLRPYPRRPWGKIYPMDHGVKSTPLSVTIVNSKLFKWPAWCRESQADPRGCSDRAP